MKTVEHRLILKSDKAIGVHSPPAPLGLVLRDIETVVRQSVLMAFERRSHVHGRPPTWLPDVSDLRFLGISGEQDTVLHFEAPRLGDAAPRLFEQMNLSYPEFASTRPDREKTGFDLLIDVLTDVAKGNEDSARFDHTLLTRILRLGRVLNGTYQEMEFPSRLADEPTAFINQETLTSADRLRVDTPSPTRVRLVGKLDMIRDSTQTFAVQLEDGQEVPGVLLEGQIESLKSLFRRRVLVLGIAVFRPSGRLLRVDADEVQPGENESSFWSQMPKPQRQKITLNDVRIPQGPKSGAAAIYGRWPGDETEEELLAALKAMD